jgi:hypothetical protein
LWSKPPFAKVGRLLRIRMPNAAQVRFIRIFIASSPVNYEERGFPYYPRSS